MQPGDRRDPGGGLSRGDPLRRVPPELVSRGGAGRRPGVSPFGPLSPGAVGLRPGGVESGSLFPRGSSASMPPAGDHEVSLTLPPDPTVVSTGSEVHGRSGALGRLPGGAGAGLRHPGLQLLTRASPRRWKGWKCAAGIRTAGRTPRLVGGAGPSGGGGRPGELLTRRYGPYVYDQLDVVESVHELGGAGDLRPGADQSDAT